MSGENLADLVEGRGAGLRGGAAEDGTLISLKCASDDATLLLPLLLQMVSSPWLVEDQITLERQLNLQTLQRQKDPSRSPTTNCAISSTAPALRS